jgi:class 3 adenylate cyclase
MMGPNPPDITLLASGESGQILPQSMSDTDDMPRMGLCVLHAVVAGKLQLSERLGPTEAAYAMERCLNRITHCARRHSASRTDVFEDRLIASFPAPAMTLLAAREMLERIRALLPMKGIKLALRAGAVMVRDAEACNEPAEDLARNMAELVSDPDGVLVSSALRDALPAPLLLRLVPVEASPESKTLRLNIQTRRHVSAHTSRATASPPGHHALPCGSAIRAAPGRLMRAIHSYYWAATRQTISWSTISSPPGNMRASSGGTIAST